MTAAVTIRCFAWLHSVSFLMPLRPKQLGSLSCVGLHRRTKVKTGLHLPETVVHCLLCRYALSSSFLTVNSVLLHSYMGSGGIREVRGRWHHSPSLCCFQWERVHMNQKGRGTFWRALARKFLQKQACICGIPNCISAQIIT